eukprot:Lithocolla_globosa_v1_NODE_6242_length_1117_cov_60.891714.p2 type:complete len:122 gc:universal NODE_6242_length_1117_cov_60.891714:203-568(+)
MTSIPNSTRNNTNNRTPTTTTSSLASLRGQSLSFSGSSSCSSSQMRLCRDQGPGDLHRNPPSYTSSPGIPRRQPSFVVHQEKRREKDWRAAIFGVKKKQARCVKPGVRLLGQVSVVELFHC